jgi:hypothetical protein
MKIKCKKSARVELEVVAGVVGVEGPCDDCVTLVTDMDLLKGLRSGKYFVKGAEIRDKSGSVIGELIEHPVDTDAYKDFHIDLAWPKPGSFWSWVYKTDRGGFFPNSLMCIALVSFFTSNFLFKGDVYAVGFLALSSSPFVTWLILRSTFVNIRYQKGGIRV